MLLFCRLGYPVIVFNGCRGLKMKQGDIMCNELRELISTLAFWENRKLFISSAFNCYHKLI